VTAAGHGLPELPPGWSARTPVEADVPALAALRVADHAPYTGEGVDEESVRSEVVGMASWTRRQLVVVPPGEDPALRAGLGAGPGRRPHDGQPLAPA